MPEATRSPTDSFTIALIAVMRGVVERESTPATWQALLRWQPRVREHVSHMALDLVLDEAEGYAFLRQRPAEPDDDTPRLVARRQLSLPVSILLALLRKRMLESDVSGGDVPLIVSSDELVELMKLFVRDTANEAKLLDKIEGTIKRVEELGFLRKLKTTDDKWEVRRILRAFIDAGWLQQLDEKLASYRAHLAQQESAS